MTAKEYLQQAYALDRKITADLERLSEMRFAAYGRGIRYSSDGSQHTKGGNSVENSLLRIAEFEERIDAEIDLLIKKREEIRHGIEAVPDPVQREVLTRRYLRFQKWGAIARATGYSKRHVYRIHNEAVKNFFEKNQKNT